MPIHIEWLAAATLAQCQFTLICLLQQILRNAQSELEATQSQVCRPRHAYAGSKHSLVEDKQKDEESLLQLRTLNYKEVDLYSLH